MTDAELEYISKKYYEYSPSNSGFPLDLTVEDVGNFVFSYSANNHTLHYLVVSGTALYHKSVSLIGWDRNPTHYIKDEDLKLIIEYLLNQFHILLANNFAKAYNSLNEEYHRREEMTLLNLDKLLRKL